MSAVSVSMRFMRWMIRSRMLSMSNRLFSDHRFSVGLR